MDIKRSTMTAQATPGQSPRAAKGQGTRKKSDIAQNLNKSVQSLRLGATVEIPRAQTEESSSFAVTKDCDISAAQAWESFSSFGDFYTSVVGLRHNTCKADGEDIVGAIRSTTAWGGPTKWMRWGQWTIVSDPKIEEILRERDDASMTITTEMLEFGPLPISSYTCTVSIVPNGVGKCKVTFRTTVEYTEDIDMEAYWENLYGEYIESVEDIHTPPPQEWAVTYDDIDLGKMTNEFTTRQYPLYF